MDRHRPRPSARSRPWLALCAGASLAACQMLPQQLSLSNPPAEPALPAWRVVERLGDARYLAPSMAGWEQITAGSLVPAGSQVTTGIGGRLIVHQADNQLSAGTNSRFILPGWGPGDSLRQTAGWLRYRIASPASATFGIETPFLDLLVDDAVVDVTVGDSETEVAVVSGRVRVKTMDGRRQIDLHAGYTGYAGLEGDPLAVRRGPGQGLERVPPTVVPALHPERAAPSGEPVAAEPVVAEPVAAEPAPASAVPFPNVPGPAPASMEAPAKAPTGAPSEIPDVVEVEPSQEALGRSAVPAVMQRPTVGPVAGADAPPAAMAPSMIAAVVTDPALLPAPGPAPPGAIGTAVLMPAAFTAPQTSPVSAAEAQRAEIRRRFDALTEGLLEGLPPAGQPAPLPDRR